MRCWCPQTSSRCLGPWLSRWNGRAMNISEIARFLGVSRPTASARVRELQRNGIVRLLPFMGAGGKSLLYLRHVYGSGPESYRSYCTEAVIEKIQELFPESSFFWWKTGYVRRIDLLAVIGDRRIGFCFSDTISPLNRDWWPFRACFAQGLIHRAFLLYRGNRAFYLGPMASAVPARAFLSEAEDWILSRCTRREVLAVNARINRYADPWSGSLRGPFPAAPAARQ